MPLKPLDLDVANYDHIVWDWNGTLLNDVDLCLEVVSELLREQNLPVPTRDEYREIFGFPIESYYQRLGFDFARTPFEELASRYIDAYDHRAHTAPLHEGAKVLLAALAEAGVKQSILSAAAESHIHDVTERMGVSDFFDHRFGIGDHMAHSKRARGHDLLQHAGIAPQRTLLIGDTDHDLEVGLAMGVEVLLVAHGHQSYERLSAIHQRVVHGFKATSP